MKSLLIKLADSIEANEKQSNPDAGASKESNGTEKDKEGKGKKKDWPPKKKDGEGSDKGKGEFPPKKDDGGGEDVAAEPKAEEVAPVENGAPADGAAIIGFFKDNPFPADADFHSFCEQNGMDTHAAESAAYALATLFVQFLTGGKSGGSGMTADDVDPDQLARGIEVEKEHVENDLIAQKISLDHLTENPSYYDYLDAMEAQAKQDMGGDQGGDGGEGESAGQGQSGPQRDPSSPGYDAGGNQGNAFDSMNQTQG